MSSLASLQDVGSAEFEEVRRVGFPLLWKTPVRLWNIPLWASWARGGSSKKPIEYSQRPQEADLYPRFLCKTALDRAFDRLWGVPKVQSGGRGAPNVVQIWRSGVKKLISRGSGDIWGPQGVFLLQQPFARVHRLVILALFSQIL